MNAEVTPLRPPATATEPSADQPRVNGVFDIPAPGRVAGWAIDRSDPSATVEVEIFREGVRVGSVKADRYRKDLENGGIGTGRYGFAMDLDPPLVPGMNFTIEARAITDDGVGGPLRATGSALSPADPETRLREQTFVRLCDLSRKLDRVAARADDPKGQIDPELLTSQLDRLELVQIRLEQAMAAREPLEIQNELQGLRLISKLALVVGLVALGTGLYSIFGG
jgi:hypothetical protein